MPAVSPNSSPTQLFGPKKAGHPAAYNNDPQFAAFKQCNDPVVAKALRVGQRQRLDPVAVAAHLAGPSLYSRLALALAESQAVDAKEVFEAFEFCVSAQVHWLQTFHAPTRSAAVPAKTFA